jgi:hypothetical protein
MSSPHGKGTARHYLGPNLSHDRSADRYKTTV